MRRFSLMAITATAFLAAVVTPSLSRASLEITPVIGMMNPVNEDVLDTNTPVILQKTSAVLGGARLTWWAMPRLGLEASAVVAGGQLQVTGGSFLTSSGSVTMADARARFRFTRPADFAQFDLIGGVGMSRARWGIQPFFDPAGLQFKSQVAWVAGLGLTVPAFTSTALRFDVEDHIHPSHVVLDPTLTTITGTKQQNDIVWTIGLVVPLGKH